MFRVLPLRRRFVVAVLGFVAFVTSFGAHVVAVNLPVYVKQVVAVYDFAEIFAKPVFGWIADRSRSDVFDSSALNAFKPTLTDSELVGQAVAPFPYRLHETVCLPFDLRLALSAY